MNKKKQIPTKPFFTRFLEKQALESVTGGDRAWNRRTIASGPGSAPVSESTLP